MASAVYTHLILRLVLAATLSSFTHCSRRPPHNRTLSRIPASPPLPPQIFSVLSYGAVGDGAADDTQPFQSAWGAACKADVPAVLLIPKNYTFMLRSATFSGPCSNHLTFQIEGSLMAAEEPNSWPENESRRKWVVFYKIDGMKMHGGGVIDGRGHKWWDLPCKPRRDVNGTILHTPGPCESPTAIRFVWVWNLVIKNLEMKNSPKFHMGIVKCRHVHVDSLYINSPAESPNTDGIHVEKSSNVNIYNSLIATGDDCISIGAGTSNVDIRNITCDHGHGIGIGSLGSKNGTACVSNVTVRDSVIKRSTNGVRIKTWQGGYGTVSKIAFTNIEMENVRNPIKINQYYCGDDAAAACSNQSLAVYLTDISYTGIRGTYDVSTPPVHLACSDSVPCTNLTVSDVELVPAQGMEMGMVDPFCWNAYGDADAVSVPPLLCLNQGAPPAPFVAVDVCTAASRGLARRGVEPWQRLNIVTILWLQFCFLFFLSIPFLRKRKYTLSPVLWSFLFVNLSFLLVKFISS